ncbi:response regulator [Prosthecobacter sp.]|uniref:ATP-binding response regulator n=1 Tax=Prosthecobacter sp. TaxID=1965333 RepID=UPI0037836A15
MQPAPRIANRRLLIIDDNPAIHEDFRKILVPETVPAHASGIEEDEAAIFGDAPPTSGAAGEVFEVDSASQGQEGLDLIRKALEEKRPYTMAFVDVRMPPGWDGIETTRQIWAICPDLQVVICTAYSDYSWNEMQVQIKPRDRLLILKKPFDTVEVLQLANALTEKWRLQQEFKGLMNDLEARVQLRTKELESSMEEAVRSREKERQSFESLRHEMEERGRLEKRFREQAALLDKTTDAIVVSDLDHRITYWNKGAERVYGWTAEEVIGRRAPELLYREFTTFESAVASIIKTSEWTGEIKQVTRAGAKLLVEARWTLLRNSAGQPQGILAINTDITEKKKLEQQFLRAQRMDSIGTLAGGIAHDLNNALTPILMSVELLKLREKDPKGMTVLSTIDNSAKRGAGMVRQLLTFASGLEGKQVVVQVGHLLKEIEKIANETFLKTIQVSSNVPADLWTVQGDPTQLHQVLLNLCVNARDAMPGGGRLSLSACNLVMDEKYVGLNGEGNPGPYVVIQVKDTGTGMPPEVIERIFEPFFTTKELGKGTGLGLSTSLGIIKSHHGFLHVDSTPGAGTRFLVYLPAQAVSAPVAEACPPAELPRGNGELVLVVDDEADVRQVVQQILEAFGYWVLLAADGSEALAMYTSRRDEIAVVLTDMMMPVMDGPATIQALKSLDPQIRIIAASGLSTSSNAAKATRAGVNHFIAKPYTTHTLLQSLNTVLQAEPALPA